MEDDFIDYGKLIDKAMRSIVKESLEIVKEKGLTGDHHFYITFYVDFPGVELSDDLKEEYDEEMTIVMQHQFWGLDITESYFTVTLSFNNKKQKLIIPFESITAFADPSVKFGLQFRQVDEELSSVLEVGRDGDNMVSDGSNVISLDTFRKK